MMMGSLEEKIEEISAAASAAPEVVDDFDVGVNEEASITTKINKKLLFLFFISVPADKFQRR